MDANEYRKLVNIGFYRDVDVQAGYGSDMGNVIQDSVDKLVGVVPSGEPEEIFLFEFHVNWDLKGFEDKDEDGEDNGASNEDGTDEETFSGNISDVQKKQQTQNAFQSDLTNLVDAWDDLGAWKGPVAGRVGGLVNYELFVDYQKLAMRMFGGFMNFYWNKVTKKLTLVRKQPFAGTGPQVTESVMLHVYNIKPDIVLLNDPQTFPWIQDYAYALTMMSIGQAREKFATIAGPQGGTSLNGAALKAEGQALLDKLDEEIKNYVDGGAPLTWLMG
jgi:hypothetical protein